MLKWAVTRRDEPNARGFPSFAKNHDYYNDDIYRNLEELANHNEEETMVTLEFPISPRRSKEEDIYEDLCYVTLRIRENVSASHVHPIEKRDYCIKELIETEKNYIEALNMIIKHFMRPLKSTLVVDVWKVIFMNIEELAEIHTGFHSELYKACTSSQYKISECFLHWKDKFIVYGEYCSKLPAAQERVEDLSNKSEVINQAILRCQQEANGGKFKLRDLLSVPMQRILKYHLLLKELIRNTPKTHEDYFGLQKALDAMLDLAQYINEVKRDNETLQIIRDIQTSITDLRMPEDLELKDYGRLLKDGELKIRSHDDNRLKNRYVFIFDKVMLMCKSTRIVDKLLGKRPPSYENPFPTPNRNTVENATLAPDYINTMLEGHDWFAGVMERDVATKKLEELPSGTFLLRISPKQNGSYAISINYQNQVKHMRVCTTDNGQHFYLSETKYFKSIVELVNWYKENSLSESFNGLHVTLMIPYKKALAGLNNESILGYAEALYDFQGNSPNMLTLHKGDRITILSKAGNQKGWWKGQIGENVGYFPYLYVKEIFD
ncbi:protein vav [Nephila pilipes]|uniref:Protein vav n=1 Tax=Nephila pilipes TaxID=299642 RepID=A0A8X6Q9I8_NEPPI|nr:protein vav [Nephila pilipes]